MRRGDVNQPGVGRQGRHAQTFRIQGNGFDVGANSPEQPPCRGIPWILDGDTITAVDEDLRNQIEGLLRPIGHGHVFGLDAHPSGEPDVTGYS